MYRSNVPGSSSFNVFTNCKLLSIFSASMSGGRMGGVGFWNRVEALGMSAVRSPGQPNIEYDTSKTLLGLNGEKRPTSSSQPNFLLRVLRSLLKLHHHTPPHSRIFTLGSDSTYPISIDGDGEGVSVPPRAPQVRTPAGRIPPFGRERNR
jgi:hypothetical protein